MLSGVNEFGGGLRGVEADTCSRFDEGDVEGAECFVLVETSGGKREHDEEV